MFFWQRKSKPIAAHTRIVLILSDFLLVFVCSSIRPSWLDGLVKLGFQMTVVCNEWRKRFDAKKVFQLHRVAESHSIEICHINLYRIYNVATLSFRVLSHIRLHVLIFWLDSFTGKVTGNHISSIKYMGVSRKLPLNQCSDLHSQWQKFSSFSTYTMFRSSMELCLGDPWCCWRGSEH